MKFRNFRISVRSATFVQRIYKSILNTSIVWTFIFHTKLVRKFIEIGPIFALPESTLTRLEIIGAEYSLSMIRKVKWYHRYTVHTTRNTFSSNQQLTSWANCGNFHSEEHQNGEQSFRRDSITSPSKHQAARAIGNSKIPCNPKRYAENSRARGGWCFVWFAFRYTWERMTRGYFSRRQCSWLLSGFAVRFFDGERRARFSGATWLHDEVSASVITCAPSLPRVSPLLREFTRSQIK